jgi:hypothetical protein
VLDLTLDRETVAPPRLEEDDDGDRLGHPQHENVTLKATPGASEKFGINSMVIHALGTGASQQPTGTWTFTPETGFTVNGSASAAFSGFTKPAMFVCVLDQSAKNWIVYIAN